MNAIRYRRAMKLKTCFRCRKALPLSSFYKHPQMADGHLGKCSECTKLDARENYDKRRARYAAYDAMRQQTPERRAAAKRYAAAGRIRNPEKAAARQAVNRAVSSGKLVKTPCVHCGSTVRIHGHHRDYSKPLDVVWCCHRCHLTIEHGKKWTDPKDRVYTKGSRWDRRRSETVRV